MFDFDRTFSRTELLLGKEKLNSLKDKKVAIFGLGGVCYGRNIKVWN